MSAMPPREPVAIYARYSTAKQDEKSIEDQVRICRRYAEQHGLEVVRMYSDDAISGTHLQRPGIQQLLADVDRRGGPPFKAVLLWDLSTIPR